MTTDEIDAKVHDAIVKAGAYPSPLNYFGFPKSICASVNEVVIHGIPDDRPLREGDIAKFDISLYYQVGGVDERRGATGLIEAHAHTRQAAIHPDALPHFTRPPTTHHDTAPPHQYINK